LSVDPEPGNAHQPEIAPTGDEFDQICFHSEFLSKT
jgi:hypothetical protein